jgi:hypothetical protein
VAELVDVDTAVNTTYGLKCICDVSFKRMSAGRQKCESKKKGAQDGRLFSGRRLA